MSTQSGFRYAPEVFVNNSIAEAKAIILTPEQGLSPEERWQRETQWLAGQISFCHQDLVIDYGCGVGRLAKLFIANPVLGVDISPTMRANAETYVGRPSFGAVCPSMLQSLIESGTRARGAIAAWVFQHCADPEYDIRLLAGALTPGSTLWVLNRHHRAVPATNGQEYRWVDDGLDIFAMLSQWAERIGGVALPEALCSPGADLTHWVRDDRPVDFNAMRTQARPARHADRH